MNKKYNYSLQNKRVINEAKSVLEMDFTIRRACKDFGVSKSTFHYDLKYRLPKIDYDLYLKVQRILDFHFSQKHINGGKALQQKYKNNR